MNIQTNQKKLPLLSVVILAYNIEKKLLDRCISSVVNQTYTNLEIILINNESTDDTGKYCDEWLQNDVRIQVIHNQKSESRMFGIKIATGEYIHLLDHDDWLDPNMYAKMMSAMLSTNSDIARCEYCLAYSDGQIEHLNITHDTDNFEIIGREKGVLLLLEHKWQSYRWQNICKKQLYDHQVFPSGNVFGDLSGTHILFHRASQTVYLHDVFYYYYQRLGSTVNPRNIQGKMSIEYQRGNSLYERYLFVKQHPQYHSMLQPLKKEVTLTSISSLWNMIDYPQFFPDNAYKTQTERLKTFSFSLRGGGKLFVSNLDLLILKILPGCYKLYYKLTYRNMKRLYRLIKNLLIRKQE